ncbi:DUF6383 domain-containing protein [Parabacteroides chinchillae]
MNKKFSTLVASGLALLGTLTVDAQTSSYTIELDSARAVTSLKSGEGLYQITNGKAVKDGLDSVVYMTAEGKLKFVHVPASADSLANTLWCVTITDKNQGQAPKYDFVNKGTSRRLDVSMEAMKMAGVPKLTINTAAADTVIVGGDTYGWAFSRTYKSSFEQDKPLYSYFGEADSVVGLSVQQEGIFLVKGAATDIDNALFTKFTLKTANEIYLNAEQINTIFGQQTADKGVNLKFNPDPNSAKFKNPFGDKDNKFFAMQVADSNYVYVLKGDSSFLRVDTAYANTVGHGFLAYNWTDLKKANLKGHPHALDSLKNNALYGQHQFMFTFKPSVDSVKIYAHKVTFQRENAKYWSVAGDTVSYKNAPVFVQDLGDSKVLTVDSLGQNTHISLQYGGCAPITENRTSVANGLYVIKNAKGQVLAAPIHHNGTIEWVTLDTQDPQRMPAYQWVVTKNLETTPELAKISPLTIVNREFDDKSETAIQLSQDKDGNISGDGKVFSTLDFTNVTFDQIKDSAYIKDSHLGYRYLDPNDLLVTKYKFNYMNPYTDDKWLGRSSDAKDSVLYVQDATGAFNMVKGNVDQIYGVTVDASLLKKIPGLAQLKRTQYVVVLGKDTLVKAAESKYAVGKVNYGETKVDSFYFKANNYYNEKDYYAFVVAKFYNTIENTAKKVGTADDGKAASLKVQDLSETRTSAFTVEPLDAPLYRRFNNAELEGNEGDASDTLRFVEQYRGEVLQIEGNKNFKVPGVDFLGIYTEGAAPSGLSFIVDTAWVNRGLGYIKPQYLISIERDDVKGTPFQRCAECQRLIDAGKEPIKDCKHDIQATPDMRFGKYLVNFADSVALGKEIGSTKKGYNWKEYDRAGFVKAIQYGDSLYILKDEFAGVTKKDVNPALLAKIIKANDAVTDSRKGYIVNLTTDKHKLITWSMRYVKPGTDNKTFLIESMKKAADKDIAPEYAAWLKMQNGCLVLSDKATSKFNEMTGGDDALIFDVKHVANDEIATDNEVITNSGISIIAGEGNVTVTGAAGKKVVITNILGQTVATAVATSDNETIVVPQGAVIVAVDGEAAVKAMVK